MKSSKFIFIILLCVYQSAISHGLKILGIFPYNGRSHHILYSSLVEELAMRNHDVTVINYFPVRKIPNLRQISIQDDTGAHCDIDMMENLNAIPDSIFKDFYRAYDMAVSFKEMANDNCKRLMTNMEIGNIINSGQTYDVVIAEQFVTDCGLAIAYKLGSPTVGMTAHTLMPWTYSRLGAPNNPAFVPNHLFGSGTKPNLYEKAKSAIINTAMSAYYRHVIQKSDQEIINRVYPEVPDLESLGKNISLIMINQYFPLSGSRLHGANVIEVGGMHVKPNENIDDKELKDFIEKAENGVVYISFGTVASNFPKQVLKEIKAFIEASKMSFVWKINNNTVNFANKNNVVVRQWLPQASILCHPNVLAFVSHSGMLSTTEAMHCGVPIIGVPLFGDQFSNAAFAMENGLGVVLDIYKLNRIDLEEALDTVLQDRYQNRAKELSEIWRDRPLSPMDSAIFWIEYVARHKGRVDMKPQSVNTNFFQYYLLDLLSVIALIVLLLIKVTKFIKSRNIVNKKMKSKKKN